MQPKQKGDSFSHQTYFSLLTSLAILLAFHSAGCNECLIGGDFVEFLVVRGTLVETNTGEGLGEAVVNARLLAGGEEIGFTFAEASDGLGRGSKADILTNEDGSFALSTRTQIRGACRLPPGRELTLPEIPMPDQVRIHVGSQGCVQDIFIDLTEETVVDLSFPDDVLELRDPIVVPPCEAPQ